LSDAAIDRDARCFGLEFLVAAAIVIRQPPSTDGGSAHSMLRACFASRVSRRFRGRF